MSPHPSLTVVAAGVLAAGCASAACAPASVVVERKEERRELQSEFRGTRTSPTGAVVPERRQVIASEYWVLGTDAQWYQVTESEWQAAEPGRALSLCR